MPLNHPVKLSPGKYLKCRRDGQIYAFSEQFQYNPNESFETIYVDENTYPLGHKFNPHPVEEKKTLTLPKKPEADKPAA